MTGWSSASPGRDVPATGFSIGVSRLMTALKNLGKLGQDDVVAPVLVTVMDGDTEALGRYQKFVQDLRAAGIRAEMYQGNWKKFGNQLKYADRRGSPIAIIQGSDERAAGKVQIKDMIEGRKQAEAIRLQRGIPRSPPRPVRDRRDRDRPRNPETPRQPGRGPREGVQLAGLHALRSYPHPSSLPTRGREGANNGAIVSRLGARRCLPNRRCISLCPPSPLWGGIQGGGGDVSDRQQTINGKARAVAQKQRHRGREEASGPNCASSRASIVCMSDGRSR